MTEQKKDTTEKPEAEDSKGTVSDKKWDLASKVLPVLVTAIAGVIVAFFTYQSGINSVQIPLNATQTAEARLALLTPTPTPTSIDMSQTPAPVLMQQENLILSKYRDTFDFNDNKVDDWRPLEHPGWFTFEKTGNIELVGSDVVLAGHSGPFLKYPLDLKSKKRSDYHERNAIYKPILKEVAGIIANIYYVSDEGYKSKDVAASFVTPYEIADKELTGEDFSQKLIPGEWNTIVWSLQAPVWWDDEEETDKEEAWNEFKQTFDDKGSSLHVARRLDNTKLDWIGIQFWVAAEDGPEQFKGTAYIDNIILVYKQ